MTVTNDIKKQRLLRMTISHYKNEECSEEEMHRFATEEHAVNAAKIHLRHGMEAYGIVSLHIPPTYTSALLILPWVVRFRPRILV